MTLADLSRTINCRSLRATGRMVSGGWNLMCMLDKKPTDQVKCAFCKQRKGIEVMFSEDYCCICGAYIGESGTQYCPECWKRIMEGKRP